MQRADSSEKTLMLGKTEGRRKRDDRGRDGWMASPTQWTWVWVNSGSWWWIGRPGMLLFMGLQRVGYGWVTEPNFDSFLISSYTSSICLICGYYWDYVKYFKVIAICFRLITNCILKCCFFTLTYPPALFYWCHKLHVLYCVSSNIDL